MKAHEVLCLLFNCFVFLTDFRICTVLLQVWPGLGTYSRSWVGRFDTVHLLRCLFGPDSLLGTYFCVLHVVCLWGAWCLSPWGYWRLHRTRKPPRCCSTVLSVVKFQPPGDKFSHSATSHTIQLDESDTNRSTYFLDVISIFWYQITSWFNKVRHTTWISLLHKKQRRLPDIGTLQGVFFFFFFGNGKVESSSPIKNNYISEFSMVRTGLRNKVCYGTLTRLNLLSFCATTPIIWLIVDGNDVGRGLSHLDTLNPLLHKVDVFLKTSRKLSLAIKQRSIIMIMIYFTRKRGNSDVCTELFPCWWIVLYLNAVSQYKNKEERHKTTLLIFDIQILIMVSGLTNFFPLFIDAQSKQRITYLAADIMEWWQLSGAIY